MLLMMTHGPSYFCKSSPAVLATKGSTKELDICFIYPSSFPEKNQAYPSHVFLIMKQAPI